MKEYVGSFPVNKGLTKKLNYGSWVIYRDPAIGLYAYNPELEEEVNLLYWNLTAKKMTERIRQSIISDIENRE